MDNFRKNLAFWLITIAALLIIGLLLVALVNASQNAGDVQTLIFLHTLTKWFPLLLPLIAVGRLVVRQMRRRRP